MKRIIALAVVAAVASTASAASFIPGNFNGWDPTTAMTDNFDGTWSYNAASAPGFEPFALLATSGDWGSKYIPSGDQWGIMDGAGALTITHDTNVYADGWVPTTNRIIMSNLNTAWTAVGDFQSQVVGGVDWDNGNAATAMSAAGGGIYTFSATLNPGNYNYKATLTGTWDAIGGDGYSRNADNVPFTVSGAPAVVNFSVNAGNGTLNVNVVPEPATISLLVLGGLLAARRRR